MLSAWTCIVSDCSVSLTFKLDSTAAAPHSVMGMGFSIITSPDLLSPPPPGLISCFQTSVNPDDAQVCTLIDDENKVEETETPETESPTTAPPTNSPTSASADFVQVGWLRTLTICISLAIGLI